MSSAGPRAIRPSRSTAYASPTHSSLLAQTLRAAEPQPGMIHPPELTESCRACASTRWIHRRRARTVGLCPRASIRARTAVSASLAKLLAECSNVHHAITGCSSTGRGTSSPCYYDAIDHFGHGFMAYHPPRMHSRQRPGFRDLPARRHCGLSLPRHDAGRCSSSPVKTPRSSSSPITAFAAVPFARVLSRCSSGLGRSGTAITACSR